MKYKNSKTRYIIKVLTPINSKMYTTTKELLEKQLAIDVELHQHIILVSSLLRDLITDNFDEDEQSPQTIFDSKHAPDISLEDYLRRIHKLTKFSAESLVLAIILMDRYIIENQTFVLNWFNVHRLLLSCLVLGVKTHDDFYYDNKAFETAGGVNVVMLQKYQLQIFQKCNYNLYVDEQKYNTFVQNLYNVYAHDSDETDESI